jgi:hypothetical protein
MTDELTNPHLADLACLVGDWDTGVSGASFLPSRDTVVHGRLEGRAIEEGRLLALRQIADPSGPPAATWVIGRDARRDARRGALRRRERGVARLRHDVRRRPVVHVADNPQFSQRFEASVGSPADTITGEWQKRGPEGAWEHDFDVTYIRLTPLI